MQRSGAAWYYHTDGLGSVTAMTDDTGGVVKSYSYDSFGNTNQMPTTPVASQVSYYTINDGTKLTRSSSPTSKKIGKGTVSQTINTDGSVKLTISNSPGYAEDGFYLRVGKLGNFNGLQIATSAGSDPISVKIWFDVDNNGEFFVWNGNTLSSLGHDAYILGPSSVQNVLTVNANSNFTSLTPGGGNYTLAQLKNGAVAGITSTTQIAIWVGLATNGGNLSATVNSIQNLVFTQPFTFTGREYDAESGLYYYRARYYDTSMGRFIQKDPIGFAGGDTNLYSYVKQNPVNWVDPWGLWQSGVEAYTPYGGGGIFFGKNPNGQWFVTVNIGWGAGAGITIYDPNGKSPGYDPNCKKQNGSGWYGNGFGVFGQAGAQLGPIAATYNTQAGLSTVNSPFQISGYFNPPGLLPEFSIGSPDSKPWKVSFGAAAGGQITWIHN